MSEQFVVTCTCGQQMQFGQEVVGQVVKCSKCWKPMMARAAQTSTSGSKAVVQELRQEMGRNEISEYVVTCPCGQQMRVGREHFGKTGKCRKCGKPVTIAPDSAKVTRTSSEYQRLSLPHSCVPSEWNVGDVILDEYEITGKLGEGGMGTVLKVHDMYWDIDMAVKCPKSDYFRTQAQKENFVRECHAWMGLDLHPHIVTCHYVRVLGGVPLVFAEYVDGGTLEEWILSGRLYRGGKKKSLERILDIAIQFAWGILFAHQQGLIHQDVKPANVMMTANGAVRVTDFGLADTRTTSEIEAGSTPGQVNLVATYRGMTPAYCSPEQANNAAGRLAGTAEEHLVKLTRATDVYSWAVTVFEMFNGCRSWEAGNIVGELLKQYLREGPAREMTRLDSEGLRTSGAHLHSVHNVSEDIPCMPLGVSQLLSRCLTPDPGTRPGDLRDILSVLLRVYSETTGGDYPRAEPRSPRLQADGLSNRALSLYDLGKTEEAFNLFKQALELSVYSFPATYNASLIRWRLGDLSDLQVVDTLVAAKEKLSHDWRPDWALGWVDMERGDVEGAILHYQNALTLGAKIESRRPMDRAARLAERKEGYPLDLFGHTAWISFAEISPNCELALSGSGDCTLRLWDLRAKKSICTLTGHQDHVTSGCFSRDGRLDLSGSGDRTLRLWDLAKRQTLRQFEGHEDTVNAATLSVDGTLVLSGCEDGNLKLWDVTTGACLRTLHGHQHAVTSVSISGDKNYLFSASKDYSLKLWDIESGRCAQTIQSPSEVLSADILPSFQWAVSGHVDGMIRIWDLAKGRCARTLQGHEGPVRSTCLSPDGQYVVSANDVGDNSKYDLSLKLWDFFSGQCIRTYREIERSLLSVRFSPDSRLIIGGGRDRMLRLWPVGERFAAPFFYAQATHVNLLSNLERKDEVFRENVRHVLGKRGAKAAFFDMLGKKSEAGFESSPSFVELQREIEAAADLELEQSARRKRIRERLGRPLPLIFNGKVAIVVLVIVGIWFSSQVLPEWLRQARHTEPDLVKGNYYQTIEAIELHELADRPSPRPPTRIPAESMLQFEMRHKEPTNRYWYRFRYRDPSGVVYHGDIDSSTALKLVAVPNPP